jgi:hypothetical protein
MNYTQCHPNMQPPAKKTKSKERNLSYNPRSQKQLEARAQKQLIPGARMEGR